MENSLYIALSRQSGLRREMTMVANNIANLNTTGFKRERMMFVDHLVKSRGGERILGEKLAFTRDVASYRDSRDGRLETTENVLDVAINGEGFFAVDTPDGERYTRNGRFSLDQTGQMVTADGHPVLTTGGGPIVFAPEDTQIAIARDGSVSTENGVIGQLRLVRFENDQRLTNLPSGLYETEDEPLDVEAPDVVQGMLEGSNVEGVVELTQMIEVHRAYERVKQFIDREDDRLKRIARELGISQQG